MDTRSTQPEPNLRTGASRSIAFGLERIGLISLRFPLVVGLAAVVLLIAAAFGTTRIKVDDSLSQLFRSETPEGKKLLERASLEKLRDLVTDLQLIEGTRGIISLFSARQPPQGNELPAPLFPEQLPEGAEYERLIQRVMSNEIIHGKVLSEDGELTLMVLALDPDVVSSSRLSDVIANIRKTIDEDLAGTGLTTRLSGVPVMQLEIRNAVEHDRLFYNAFGFAAGALIAIVFFRRLSFMIIAAGPPLIAIVIALCALGWVHFRLDMFLNVMTPLIMVISFSDSMQLTFAARDRLLAGQDKYTAVRNATLLVGPPCVPPHGAAGISFIALQFSDSDLI